MADLTVANTIMNQLGGRRFVAMTGARNILGGENFVSFRIPATMTKNRINYVKVILEPSDTYTVEFSAIHGRNVKLVSTHDDIYCDVLQELFTEHTGLDTRL